MENKFESFYEKEINTQKISIEDLNTLILLSLQQFNADFLKINNNIYDNFRKNR